MLLWMKASSVQVTLAVGLLLTAAIAALAAGHAEQARAQAAPLWVNDLKYGSVGGGFYWDPQSTQVWTGERSWHFFSPEPARTVTPLWVNDLQYPSVGGGFHLDPLSAQVWTGECGWHYFNRAGCGYVPPAPSPAPAPNPSPSPAGITTRNATWYQGSTGTIYVLGEVVNGLSQPVQYVEITARFYSSTNVLLATDFTFSDISIIAAGADSPFTVLLFEPPPGITDVSVEVTDYVSPPYSNGTPITGLSVTVTNTYTTSSGTLHFVGTVTNTSSRTYRYVQPIVALYAADGRVVDVDFTFTEPTDLAPGQSATFDLLFFDPPAYARYRTWVDAN